MKIAYVKILLEQCLQKGFNVNSYCAKDENNLTTAFFKNKQKPLFKRSLNQIFDSQDASVNTGA